MDFNYGASKCDFFGTSPTFHLFFLSDYILRLNILFINGKTALIATNYLNFIVNKEKIIYQS